MMRSSGVLVAILAAFLFALTDTTMRSALRFNTPIMVSLLTEAIQWVIYTVVLLATGGFSAVNLPGLLWFILAGLLSPALFLTFFLLGIQRMGVARSSPLKGSAPKAFRVSGGKFHLGGGWQVADVKDHIIWHVPTVA